MRGGVFSKNIWEGAKERASDEMKFNSVRDPNKRHKNAFINILRDTEKIYNQHLEDICDL